MELPSLLKCMILLSLAVDDVLFELLIRVVRVSAKRSSLFEKLEDVDHANNFYYDSNYNYNNQMLKKVVQNFGSITVMRVLSRIVHFFLKTYLIRNQLNEQILAHMLHLELILSASLHIAKSCFKPSYQKAHNNDNIVKSSMNIMTFGVFATIISTAIVGFMQHYQFVSSGKILLYFTDSIALYALSSVLEAVAEKYMVELVIKYEYLKIGVIQVISIVPKTLLIFVAAYYNYFQTYGILIFGLGQLVYSFTLMVIYFYYSSNKSLFLQPININKEYLLFDPKSKQALKQFSFISILKFILQQFQQIVLVIMDISHVSSIYSLINNLGSVIVRYLFAPLNQIIFNHFSRGSGQDSIKALISFIKSILIFSIMAMSFGYNYSQIFLMLLYGQKWVTEQSISALRTYMLLVVFLGLNGVIEAFLFARGKQSIKRYNYSSIFITGIYLGSTILFLKLGFGATGLFFGNIINMASRIIMCWYLDISIHVGLLDVVKEVKPSLFFMITSAFLFLISHGSYGYALSIFNSNILKLAVGIVLFALNLLPIVFQNRTWIINQLKQRIFKPKRQ